MGLAPSRHCWSQWRARRCRDAQTTNVRPQQIWDYCGVCYNTFTDGGLRSSCQGVEGPSFLEKAVKKHWKWFLVVFLIVIAVEALVIVALVVAFFTSGQSLPGINFQSYVRPRCMNLSVLQLGPNSTGISGNRTVEFGCLIWDSRYNVFQSSTALSRVSGLADWSIGGGPHPMSAVPTFKLPTGYLELYLGGYGCGQHDVGIVSGAPAVFTDYHWEYYYCAVISNAVGSTQPFTVHWSQFKDLPFVPPPI